MSSNNKVETLKVMLLDPGPVAEMLEVIAAPYLKHTNLVNPVRPTNSLNGGSSYNDVVIANKPVVDANTPSVGVVMVKKYIDRIIQSNTAWSNAKVPTLSEIWGDDLLPQYATSIDVLESIENILSDTRTIVSQFIGDDKWNIHIQNSRHNDILIEKCTDYRIFQYHEHNGWE